MDSPSTRSDPPSSPLVRLFTYAKGHRPRVARASLYSFLNKLFDIAPEALIGVAVDIVVNREASFLARLGIVRLSDQLWTVGGLTLAIWVFESLFEYLYSVEWRTLAQTLQHELRMDAYAHTQKLDLHYFENARTGNLVAIINDDVNQLERFLDTGANALIQVTTTVILIGGIFFYLSPTIAALAFLPIPVILIGAFSFQHRVSPRYAAVRARAADLATRLQNNILGMMTIKAYTQEDRELENVRRESLAYSTANGAAIRLSSAFIPVIRMAILFGFLATLVVGGQKALAGELAVASYSILVFLTQRLLWPLTGLAQTVDLFERAMASTTRILDLLATPVTIRDGETSVETTSVSGDIAFRSVTFAYENRPALFEGLSFHLKAGGTYAFVGQTGSGKSTLAKLLLRFYHPQAGCILLDGLDVASVRLRDLRGLIGFVSQDFFLIEGTVADNILFGASGKGRQDAERAARLAAADEFIADLPEGLDTPVGERGQKLSTGQKQRIAIARALVKDPHILVLDEATSAVDNETEAAIQRSLDDITKGRTTLVIAHRLSTIRNADRIFVLDKGNIVESGTHEELLEAQGGSGLYRALWSVQTGRGAHGVGLTSGTK